jgi:hypothetical protein
VISVLEKPYSGEPFPGHDRINHTSDVLAGAVIQDWQDMFRSQFLEGLGVQGLRIGTEPHQR